jgi:anti-anti-sigma factor
MHLNHMTLTLEHARCEILPSDPDGWIEVRVEGTMDQAGARGVEGSVRFATMDAPAGVLIDCTRCAFVDSSGLRLLVESQQMAAARSIGWRLRPSDQLRKLLMATSLDDMLTEPPAA